MSTTEVFRWFGRRERVIRWIAAPLLALLVAGIALIVYRTGGIKFVYSHSMYIPVLLSGFVFGFRGGVLMGLVGGLALGPFMPIDVETGEMQETVNWLYRTGIFTLIGFLGGVASDSVRYYLRHINWAARHDAASGLPNRSALLYQMSRLAPGKTKSGRFYLVAISIENVSELKSGFGIGVIEEIVRQCAARFEVALPGRTTAYRTGTEQVALLIRHVEDHEAEPMLAGVMQRSREPFLFNDIPIHVDSRIGYVQFDKVAGEPDGYLQKAEAALLDAHERAQDCVAYGPGVGAFARENLSMLGELMEAVENGQLSMHYQPKIAISTGEVHGVEALMRWNHPERGTIPPGVFIPRAEKSTLIHLIARFSLEQAMEQMMRWRQAGIRVPIAVNISPRNLLQPGFCELVSELSARYGIDGDLLELEVTEGALMTDMERAIEELGRLASARIAISIDDFGTGYSSLQYLHRLPISFIKIDQSFVRRLPGDTGAAHIVEAAVALAHRMGMQAIAEGVETEEVRTMLADMDCDFAQGFLICRPLPAPAFEQWYAAYRKNLGQTVA